MNEELREQLLSFLRENLTLNVVTAHSYNGSGSGPLYIECHTLQLLIEDEVISEVFL